MKSFPNLLTISCLALVLVANPVQAATAHQTEAKKGLFSKIFSKKDNAEKRAERISLKEERKRTKKANVKPRVGFFFARNQTAPVQRVVAQTQDPANPYVVNENLLKKGNRENTKFLVDIGRQWAFLMVEGRVALKTPVSTARADKYTPTGTFRISERIRTGKISTIYKSEMPYWMRLNHTEFGVHAGYLPGYPASAGCVRLPRSAAQLVYDHTQSGTMVEIQN